MKISVRYTYNKLINKPQLMGETFTLNALANLNNNEVKKENVNENLEGDELMFYHSLRNDLELMQKKPKLQTIHYILDYSKSTR